MGILSCALGRNHAPTFHERHELVGGRSSDLVHLTAGPADLDFVHLAHLPQSEVLAQVALSDVTGAAQHLADLTTPPAVTAMRAPMPERSDFVPAAFTFSQ